MSDEQRDEHVDQRLAALIEECVPPTTAQPDWGDVRRRAEIRSTGRRNTARHPGVIWLAAAAALIAVVTLTAVLRNTSPDPVGSSAPKIAPTRVDWGMTAEVRVKPDPGVPMDHALNGAATTLRTRAALRDIAGFEVTGVSPDTLRMRVPAAEDKDQLEDLLRFDRLEVIDPTVSVVATDDSLEKAGRVAARHRTPNGDLRFWLSSHTNRLFPPASFATLAEARKAPVFAPAGAYEPVPLPSAFTAASLQSDRPQPTYAVVNEQRLVSGTDIESITAEGDRVRVTVSAEAQARLRDARGLAVAQTDWGGGLVVLADTVHLVGDDVVLKARTESAASGLIQSAGQPGLEATLSLATTAHYGTRPTPVGKPQPPPTEPAPIAGTRTKADWKLIELRPAQPDQKAVEVGVGVAPNEPLRATFTFVGPGGGGGVVSFGNPCPRGLGAPVVQICASSLQPGATADGKADENLHVDFGGQAAPDVSSVEIRFPSGHSATGPAKDGWFVVSTTVRGDDRRSDPTFIARTADGDVAFDGLPASMALPYGMHSLARNHEMEIARQTQNPGWARPDQARTMMERATTSTTPPRP